jgi:hypothetical protein
VNFLGCFFASFTFAGELLVSFGWGAMPRRSETICKRVDGLLCLSDFPREISVRAYRPRIFWFLWLGCVSDEEFDRFWREKV